MRDPWELELPWEYLTEANQRKDIEASVKSYNYARMTHLIKIYFYRDYKYVDGWCTEIANFPTKMSIMKGSGKRPNEDAISEWMMDGFSDDFIGHGNIRAIIKDINQKAREPGKPGLPKIRSGSTVVWEFLDKIVEWISEQYAKSGQLCPVELNTRIRYLFNTNPRWYYSLEK